MNIFQDYYADNYDLFYKSKDYKKEAEYILGLASKYNVIPENLLDLGCGTGRHAFEWAKNGIRVKGIDQSDKMLSIANQGLFNLNNKERELILFEKNDITDFLVEEEKYELVTTMFAVLGYVIDTNKLSFLFKKISASLKKNALFICDTWNGNAVLTEKPETRFNQFIKDNKTLFRISEPEIDYFKQTVTVNYKLIEIGNESMIYQEKHIMRYFFFQEMKLLAQISGLELINVFPFMSEEELTEKDWNIQWVFKKN